EGRRAALAARRTLRLPARVPAALHPHGADLRRAERVPRAAPRARAWPRDPLRGRRGLAQRRGRRAGRRGAGRSRAARALSPDPSRRAVSEIDARQVREWGELYSNWGRWGEDDERGTLNFITPERVLAACALPRRGLVISCALPFDAKGPQSGV